MFFCFSDYSDVLTVSTSGNAPTAPDPPQLTEADTFSLHLAWQKRPGDEEFVLQMDDSATVSQPHCFRILHLI